MRPICFYHKADLDGVCSAAIVKHFVPDCELYGIDYGEEFPWEKACEGATDWVLVGGEEQHPPIKERRTVYLVDFSLPVEDMKRLAEVSDLVWIDHHKTAIEALNEFRNDISGFQIVDWAACELCWRWFTGDRVGEQPEAVRLLGVYDSWRKDDPEWDSKVMPFQYGMRSVPGIYDPGCAVWGDFFTGRNPTGSASETSVVALGHAILSFQAQQNAKIAEAGAFEMTLHKYQPTRLDHPEWGVRVPELLESLEQIRCICLNTPVFNSQAFESVYDPEKHDVMVPFARMANGKWKVSLYSTKPEIDCGAIAKTFGGGGHKGAAGFVCDDIEWMMGTAESEWL